MKRLVLGLLATLLVAAGLVSASSTPASAACPYTNCIQTSLNSEGPRVIRQGKKATIKVGVRAAGNVYPTGTVRFTVYKKGQRGSIFQRTKNVSPAERYVSRTRFTTPRLSPGTYTIRMRYTPTAGSVFKVSTNKRTLTVRRR
ncbi:Ig-like domain repeat protein [Nocardioides litoris]|uniref:Ig-like domain repeat protein n=1 Tax=Nocardioides litoris TaxID=1926648 RepID=UPI0011211B80|nr:Ig-like domain repeat protein [Nocardioides litoris]